MSDSKGTADVRVYGEVDVPGVDAAEGVGAPFQLPCLCYEGQAENRRCGSQPLGQEPGNWSSVFCPEAHVGPGGTMKVERGMCVRLGVTYLSLR